MSPRAAKWSLWLLLYCTAPVPYTLGPIETAPPLRLTLFSSLILGARLSEGPGGWVWSALLALGIAQCLFYVAFTYAVAMFLARIFARMDDAGRLRAIVAGAIVVVGLVSLVPVYETPISSVAMHSTLLGIFH